MGSARQRQVLTRVATSTSSARSDTFRQTRFSTYCNGCPSHKVIRTSSVLTNCAPIPNPEGMNPELAFDLSRYGDLFLQPSGRAGIKTTADDSSSSASTAPTRGSVDMSRDDRRCDAVVDNTTGLGKLPRPDLSDCAALGGMRAAFPALMPEHRQPGSSSPIRAVRMNGLIRQANSTDHQHLRRGRDRAPDYTMAIKDLGQLILSQIAPVHPAPLKKPGGYRGPGAGNTSNPDGPSSVHVLPKCEQRHAGVPVLEAAQRPRWLPFKFSPDSIASPSTQGQ